VISRRIWRARALIWVRWSEGDGWSLWHRAAPGVDIEEVRVLGVLVQRIDARASLARPRVTSCGIPVGLDRPTEERDVLDIREERCGICVSGRRIETAPPNGSPTGEPSRFRSGTVLQTARRRRPLNQPRV
jgi:hypothetical protein